MNSMYFKGLLLLVVSALLLGSCTNSYKVIESSSTNNTVNSDLLTTDSLYVIVSPYKTQLESSMSEVLNISKVNLERDVPEGLLNNFVADLSLVKANQFSENQVDVCLLNNGGLRVPIMRGDVTRGMIFELMPFENELVVVDLKGEAMVDLVNYVVKRSVGANTKTGVSLSGMTVRISDGKATEVTVGGKAFEEDKVYRVVTSDYLADGGDEMIFFEAGEGIEKLDLKLRDAIIDHIIELADNGVNIDAKLDGRVYISE